MGLFAAGEVVLMSFPYSDLSRSKERPVLLVTRVDHEDWLSCQITRNSYSDADALALDSKSFADGGLRHNSFLRPGKLFIADESLVLDRLGALTPAAFIEAQNGIAAIVMSGKS
jgi:mRNA interferase MazF